MKKLTGFLAVLSILTLLTISCNKDRYYIEGEGDIITEELSINDFIGVDLQEDADVFIYQGAIQKVIAIGHENIVSRLKDNVYLGVWDIDLGKDLFKNFELEIHITIPDLEKVFVSGLGEVLIDDFVEQRNLELGISGFGNIELNDFEGLSDLEVNLSGKGKVVTNDEIKGVENIKISCSGSGGFNGFPIETQKCKISISGLGNCYVNVVDELDVNISGSGKVYYKGSPHISSHESGNGKIINAN